jgi:hypothetical protein
MNIDQGDNSCGIAADLAGFPDCSAVCSVAAGGVATEGELAAAGEAATAGGAATASEAAGGAALGDADEACTGAEGLWPS